MTLYESLYPTGQHDFKALNLRCTSYRDGVKITDVTDAMRPGKTCLHWSFRISGGDTLAGYEAVEVATGCDTIEELAAFLRSGKDFLPATGIDVYADDLKACRVFSPWATVAPLKGTPEKWTLAHVVRGIMAGQIAEGQIDSITTDDYAYDNAVNCREGEAFDLLKYAEELTEHPSGWSVFSAKPRKDGGIDLGIACYTFDFRTLVFHPSEVEQSKDPIQKHDPYKWLNAYKAAHATA